jgi:hypothetical protein
VWGFVADQAPPELPLEPAPGPAELRRFVAAAAA